MKRFAFLRLEHNANKVVFDIRASDRSEAVEKAKASVTNVVLDDDGYAKLGDTTFCIAEYWEPFYTV